MADGWNLTGAKKDSQTITSDWISLQTLLDGVSYKEVKNVMKDDGMLTEIFRSDWLPEHAEVDQVFQVGLNPGQYSCWHAHEFTTDRLFINHGDIKVALYDGRKNSSSYRQLNTFRFGEHRPALLIVPPQVWHAVYNPGPSYGSLINLVDQAYSYDDPDHWRLPNPTDQIPFQFGG